MGNSDSTLTRYYNRKIEGSIQDFVDAVVHMAAENGMEVLVDPHTYNIIGVHGATEDSLHLVLEALSIALEAVYEADSDSEIVSFMAELIHSYVELFDGMLNDSISTIRTLH